MYHPSNGPRSYKPQTKHAERIILPSSSQVYSQIYLWVQRSWETRRKNDFIIFLLSFSHKTLDYRSLQTKAVIELIHAQNDIAFVIVAPFSQFVCKLASCGSVKFQTDAILNNTQKVEVQTCAYCTCTVHMQSYFTTLWLSWLHLRCLMNPCQFDIRWLTTARRNSYQPVLVRIYHNCAILEA